MNSNQNTSSECLYCNGTGRQDALMPLWDTQPPMIPVCCYCGGLGIDFAYPRQFHLTSIIRRGLMLHWVSFVAYQRYSRLIELYESGPEKLSAAFDRLIAVLQHQPLDLSAMIYAVEDVVFYVCALERDRPRDPIELIGLMLGSESLNPKQMTERTLKLKKVAHEHAERVFDGRLEGEELEPMRNELARLKPSPSDPRYRRAEELAACWYLHRVRRVGRARGHELRSGCLASRLANEFECRIQAHPFREPTPQEVQAFSGLNTTRAPTLEGLEARHLVNIFDAGHCYGTKHTDGSTEFRLAAEFGLFTNFAVDGDNRQLVIFDPTGTPGNAAIVQWGKGSLGLWCRTTHWMDILAAIMVYDLKYEGRGFDRTTGRRKPLEKGMREPAMRVALLFCSRGANIAVPPGAHIPSLLDQFDYPEALQPVNDPILQQTILIHRRDQELFVALHKAALEVLQEQGVQPGQTIELSDKELERLKRLIRQRMNG